MSEENKIAVKSEIPFGIDLGTTNICAGVWWNEKVDVIANDLSFRTTPSYHYFDGINSYIGKTARDKIGTNPENVFYDAKRLLTQNTDSPVIQKFKSQWSFDLKCNPNNGNFCEYIVNETSDSISPLVVSAEILKYMKNCAKRTFRQEINEVVISIPDYFSANQIYATYEAAKLANLNVLSLITDTTAAAIEFAIEQHRCKSYENLFILDLGGGGFSVAIIKTNGQDFETLAAGGNSEVGGRDFDYLFFEWMKQKLTEQVFNVENLNQKKKLKMLTQAQFLKEALTIQHEVSVILSDNFETAKNYSLKRSEFEAMSESLVETIENECRNLFENINFSPSDIDYILFVGGSSRMAVYTKIMKTIFLDETKFSKVVNPDEAVAAGATIYASSCMKASKRRGINELNIQNVMSFNDEIRIAGLSKLINRN